MIPKRMKLYILIFGILVIGFLIYWNIKDIIFSSLPEMEAYENPAPTSIQIRQAPIYPPRNVAPSGPHSPNQEAHNEIIIHSEPGPKDPYYESHENSNIPENLRHPERSFRPPPMNDNTQIAVEAGIASNNIQVTSDNSQTFKTELIQSGGEFMPGIFANDTLSDKSYSTF